VRLDEPPRRLRRLVQDAVDGIFDAVLDSASIGSLKGDLVDGQSPFFGPWLSDQRIAPAEAVLVDDSPPASAAAIGLQTRLVEHPGRVVSILTRAALARFRRPGSAETTGELIQLPALAGPRARRSVMNP
jgi:hypothetical protein